MIGRTGIAGIGAMLLAVVGAMPALAAPCRLTQYIDLPVTMRGDRPLVTAQIGGRDARFILDSGAFFSTLSRASAAAYGLRLEAAPAGLRLNGINGAASAYVTTASDFGLNGIVLPHVQFVVGGSDIGEVGLLGQNFLGLGDVEYDLPHGQVRIFKASDCAPGALAYWAGTRPVTVVPLEPRVTVGGHTVGAITLDGVRLHAVFDSGAPTSVMTLAAARRAGIRPDSPGVVPAGISTGLGSRSERTWLATFRSIDIGGEAIPHPKIRIADIEVGNQDMLIGADFFRTHRIYVANRANKMLVTYEGGPMFGLNETHAVGTDGKPLDLTDTSAAPTDAEGYARRGAVFASNHKLDEALADLDKAVAMAPGEARYLAERAGIHLANRQPLLAASDLDKALAIDPNNVDAHMTRAMLRLGARDPSGAGEDLGALDKALPATANQRLPLAQMADAAGLSDLALANVDAWLKSHADDAARPVALNARCWMRAQLNRDLDKALEDCNGAVRARPGTGAYLDSRALVRFRRGEWPQALADYDAAIQAAPKNAWSLYARGLVKRKMGDAPGAEADRKAALALAPNIAERARRIGLEG